MLATAPARSVSQPSIRYIGDPETGIVHLPTCHHASAATVIFLDVRTAVVRGYRLCTCCKR
jgi:hypothetical protein